MLSVALDHELVSLDADELAELDALLSNRLRHTLVSAYEHGWLPLDLLHYIRQTREALVPALATAIITHARDIGAEERAPRRWREQLPVVADHGRGFRRQSRSDVLQLLAVMSVMPTLEQLLPPPSMWDRAVYRQTFDGDPDRNGTGCSTRSGRCWPRPRRPSSPPRPRRSPPRPRT